VPVVRGGEGDMPAVGMIILGAIILAGVLAWRSWK